MDPELFVGRILDDEGIVADLDEAEATKLVSWLVARAVTTAEASTDEEEAGENVAELARLGRGMARCVALWRDQGIEPAQRYAREKGFGELHENLDSPAAVLDWLLEQNDTD